MVIVEVGLYTEIVVSGKVKTAKAKMVHVKERSDVRQEIVVQSTLLMYAFVKTFVLFWKCCRRRQMRRWIAQEIHEPL